MPIDPARGPSQASGPLRICVLIKSEADPVAGGFVPLRETMDARVFLGCIVDAAGNVMEWVQVWVQTLSGLSGSIGEAREALGNKILDDRWKRLAEAFASLGRAGDVIVTGWERAHVPPLVIDRDGNATAIADDASKAAWVLCTDDTILSAAGLPVYSTSLHRYLHQPENADSAFVPVTVNAPATERTRDLATLKLSGASGRTAFNIEGGLLLIRRHSAVPVEAFIDVLSGRPWSGVLHGTAAVPLTGVVESLKQCVGDGGTAANVDGHLFLGRHGRWGRMVESFHLKLRLVADMVSVVRKFTAATERPMLSLSVESFSVQLADPACGLPFLWGSAISLDDPGDAIVLPVPGSDVKYFHRRRTGLSVYQPESVGRAVEGLCTLRIRQIVPDTAEGVMIEGTVATQEKMEVLPNDVVILRPAVASGRVELFARLESDSAKVMGEWRFRTIAQPIEAAVLKELQAAAGVPLPRVPFQLIPLLSTPCDLYSLAVLAVQAVLVNPKRATLPVVLDEVMSLARQVAQEHDESVGLGLRIRAIFEQDARWLGVLGPHCLSNEEITPQQALDLIPAELWWDTLAGIVRMFPGLGPDSACKNFGDAAPLAVHKAFDRAISDLDSLMQRTRSLIVIDWRFNREIRSILRGKLASLAPEASRKTPAVKA